MEGKMRAAYLRGIEGKNFDIAVHEIDIPETRKGEVLVRVYSVGLCGSDVDIGYRKDKIAQALGRGEKGIVLGHEIAGEVAEVGTGVRGYKEGDRVVVAHHIPCGDCYDCDNDHETACEMLHNTNVDPGGLAEYIRLSKDHVDRGIHRLPDSLSYEEGACVEPLGCVLRGQRAAEIGNERQSVLILGSGNVGALHIKLARAKGAGRIYATDVDKYRIKTAKKFGADEVLNVEGLDDRTIYEWLYNVNSGRGADRVIVCVGAQKVAEQAMRLVSPGGTLLYFAVPHGSGPEGEVFLPYSRKALRAEISIKSTYAAGPKDMIEALKLIESRRVNVKDMITHNFSFEEIGRAFNLTARPENSGKVLVEVYKPAEELRIESAEETPIESDKMRELEYCKNALHAIEIISKPFLGNPITRLVCAAQKCSQHESINGTERIVTTPYGISDEDNGRMSSEFMVLAKVFDNTPSARFAFYNNSRFIWRNARELGMPTTRENAMVGTLELAEEIDRLFRETDVRRWNAFAVGGQEGAIVTYARNSYEAAGAIVALLGVSTGTRLSMPGMTSGYKTAADVYRKLRQFAVA